MAECCVDIRKQETPDKHTQLQLGLCPTDLVPAPFNCVGHGYLSVERDKL